MVSPTGSYIGQSKTANSSAQGIYNIGVTANQQTNWPTVTHNAVNEPFQLTSITGGNSLNTWNTYTAGGISSLANRTGHIIFNMAATTFYADMQIDDVVVDGTTIWNTNTNNTGWKQLPGYRTDTETQIANHYISYTSAQRDKYQFMSHIANEQTWFNLGTQIGTSGLGFWTADNAGTPSSSTGSTVDGGNSGIGYYIYFEASGSAFPHAALLKTPQITFDSSPNFSFKYSRFGSNFTSIAKCEIWFVDAF